MQSSSDIVGNDPFPSLLSLDLNNESLTRIYIISYAYAYVVHVNSGRTPGRGAAMMLLVGHDNNGNGTKKIKVLLQLSDCLKSL